jgi:mannosyltransferase
VARTPEQADGLYAVQCARPATCLGNERRIWVVESGHHHAPGGANLPIAQEALLARNYRLAMVRRVPAMTVFLLVKRQPPVGART